MNTKISFVVVKLFAIKTGCIEQFSSSSIRSIFAFYFCHRDDETISPAIPSSHQHTCQAEGMISISANQRIFTKIPVHD